MLVVADHLCTMTVIDMSYNSPGLRVLYFAPLDNMPRVNALGDIIRFHRIEVYQLFTDRSSWGFTMRPLNAFVFLRLLFDLLSFVAEYTVVCCMLRAGPIDWFAL